MTVKLFFTEHLLSDSYSSRHILLHLVLTTASGRKYYEYACFISRKLKPREIKQLTQGQPETGHKRDLMLGSLALASKPLQERNKFRLSGHRIWFAGEFLQFIVFFFFFFFFYRRVSGHCPTCNVPHPKPKGR